MTRGTIAMKAILLIAGTIGCVVGLASLVLPVEFEAGAGIIIGSNISLINELRASGGGLFAVSLCIMAGAFIAELAYHSALLATIVYFGYGLARLLSIALDGMPHPLLLLVTAMEIIIGLLCLVVLLKCRKQRGQSG